MSQPERNGCSYCRECAVCGSQLGAAVEELEREVEIWKSRHKTINDAANEKLAAAEAELEKWRAGCHDKEWREMQEENAKLRERVTQIENDAQIRHAQLLKCSDDVERLEAKLALAVERLNYIVEKDLDDQPARACINDAFEFQDIARETLEKLK